MRQYLFPVFLLLFVYQATNAQDKSIKLYSNIHFLNSDQLPRQLDYEPAAINYGGLTLAFNKTTQRSMFHQVELRTAFKSKSNDEYEFKGRYVHLRCELGKYWRGKEGKAFDFYIGGAFRLFYLNEDAERHPIFNNPTREEIYGVEFAPVGGVVYNISKKMFVEIGAVLSAFSFSQENAIVDNPAILAGRRNSKIYAFDGFNDRRLRLGVGYRISAAPN